MPTSPNLASLVKVDFRPDGSTHPPGDLLCIHVLFYPGQEEAELQIRAYVVTGDRNQTVTAVRSRDGAFTGQEGSLLIIAHVKRPEDAPIAVADVVVPYAAIDLPRGRHLLGYEIRGVCGESIEFMTATRATYLRVSDERRGHVMMQTERWVPDTRIETQQAVIVKGSEFHEAEFDTVKESRRPVFECADVDADIPGGYERFELQGVPVSDDAHPLEVYLAELKQRPWVPLANRTIYFVTNRDIRNPNDKSLKRFGNRINDKNTFGCSSVAIPIEVHARGALELPRWWERRNPKRHFLIESVQELTERAFLGSVGERLACKKEDVLLFVHGFNNSLADATLRLAQLTHDIRFPGTPMVFGWPSEARLGRRAYRRDEEKASQSNAHLAGALMGLIQKRRESTDDQGVIHLVAHSMGNRVLLGAVHEMRTFLERDESPFGHVILAAPDTDVASFVSLIPSLLDSSRSVTMYFCRADKALQVSRLLHLDRRVGETPVFISGLDNIDAERANTSFLGHDYFVSRSELLIDLEMLINMNLPPQRRPTVRKVTWRDLLYWMFP